MRGTSLEHKFGEFIPDELAEATIYISMPYATAVHLCLCGCGQHVVTPLSPTDWRLIFDGETVSLHPSVGNWNFECQSHYWIERGYVQWAGRWSQAMIEAARARDRHAKEQYFEDLAVAAEVAPSEVAECTPTPSRVHQWFARLPWSKSRSTVDAAQKRVAPSNRERQ